MAIRLDCNLTAQVIVCSTELICICVEI